MAYRLKFNESVQDGIRRVISQQIERAVSELEDPNMDRAEIIHQVRKRCKKIRAALRLVRPGMADTFSKENAWYRDAALKLSDVRDAEAVLEIYDALTEHFPERIEEEVKQKVRVHLEGKKEALTGDSDRLESLLHDFELAMKTGFERVSSIKIKGDGFETALAGMRMTYTRGRKAMDAAYREHSPETFHEWRKRTKYHWYHMRLLRAAWPVVVRARRNEANKLGDSLGNHHNLYVLRSIFMNDPGLIADESSRFFLNLTEEWIKQIEHDVKADGKRLFAERPKNLTRRFAAYLAAGYRKN